MILLKNDNLLPLNKNKVNFRKKIEDGEISESCVDDKVRRILRVMFAIGMFDENRKPGAINTPEHQVAALKTAEEAIDPIEK